MKTVKVVSQESKLNASFWFASFFSHLSLRKNYQVWGEDTNHFEVDIKSVLELFTKFG